MRRLLVLLAVVAGLSIAAAPVLAATTMHTRQAGTGLAAYFSNVELDADGNVLPGSYVEAGVDAATQLSVGDDPWEDAYACAYYVEFTVDESGEGTEDSWISGCGPYDTLTVSRQLTNGHLVASLPVEDCLAWDEETWECLEWQDLGTFDVDLVLASSGRPINWHERYSGGTAGSYQYNYHGNGTQRNATAAGTFEFNGVSVLDGATMDGGYMFRSKSGWIDILH
jgi:hypothetical protein